MRIAILTFHRAFNCGARLQAWALQTVLERMGYTVEFPDCNEVGFLKRFIPFERKTTLVRQFISLIYRVVLNFLSLFYNDIIRNRYRKFNKCLNCVSVKPVDFGSRYDVVVVGSDQVWNEQISSPNSALFLGEKISSTMPLIAYAASLGEHPLSDCYINQLKEKLKRFKSISVRENSGVEKLKKLGYSNVVNVVDPTLLLLRQDYDRIRASIALKGDVLFSYIVSYSDASISKIRDVARVLDVKCHISRSFEFSFLTSHKSFSYPVSPAHLLAYTAQAKYVIPASFHGMVFAILYKKPFVCMRPQKDCHESRPASLLKLLGMSNRIVTPETPIEDIISVLNEPYPNDIDEKIKVIQEFSLEWLNNAINNSSC